MLVLALDTSTRVGSCALARDGVVLHELASDPSKSHAEHLPGDLMVLLEHASTGLDAIDVFAVTTGPGSFTGLRVGIATMQGLAFARGKPLIGVSALDALAAIVRSNFRNSMPDGGRGLIATWINAWRGEVYAALYDNHHAIEGPTVELPDAILGRLLRSRLPTPASPITFVGDGAAALAPLIQNSMGDRAVIADPHEPLLAGVVAQLATDAAANGVLPPPDAIRPLYVRRTDAELARDARVRP
jgi:tRNA threonylcarbamoyladenosine biosynthesis protein TsaB